MDVAARMDRLVTIRDGEMVEMGQGPLAGARRDGRRMALGEHAIASASIKELGQVCFADFRAAATALVERALSRFAPFGVPRPVQASQPTFAA